MSLAHVKIAENGRLVIPATLRKEAGIDSNQPYVIRVEGDSLVIEPERRNLDRIRALVRRYVPEGVSLSEELISDRRADADHE